MLYSSSRASPSALSDSNTLQSSAPPADVPRPSPRKPRHWNFRLRSLGKSRRTVEVAPARDEDRYGITPETDAEAAAAMQRTDGDEADNSTQLGQPAAGAQASQVQPIKTQAQVSTSEPDDILCGVNCCGNFFGFRRPASHQA
ncbi:hypothetical protein P692DRAFT_20880205 [Suillus brevipes Sb2]|nr:hypothetical protein P692DRAFT_20880205 [Suillus brevipes Sb2]